MTPTELLRHARAAKNASPLSTVPFPPQLLLAHMAIESSWGEKKIGNNNYFGMSYVPDRHSESVWVPTTEFLTNAEYERAKERADIRFLGGKPTNIVKKGFTVFEFKAEKMFADFPSLTDAYGDVVKLIGCVYSPNKSAYKVPWRRFRDGLINWKQFAMEYAPIYATGPGYGDLLVKIASQSNIKKALDDAK